ncbi:MAG: hypothetical protein LBS53_05180 [Synergistaceae bacterium]|jgi:hypothetical protein|nr:hypothetical protein [Synergistaceae bacterium]
MEQEEGRGDVFNDEDEFSPFTILPIGISKEDALEAGAEATDDDDVMKGETNWVDVEWDVVLMFEKGKLATLAIQTAFDLTTLVAVLNKFDAYGYEPWQMTGAGGDNVEFYTLKAQGMNYDELEQEYQVQIESFLEGDAEKLSIILCLDEVLDAFADVAKKKGDGDALIKKEADSVIYAVTIDKKKETILVLMSTFGTLNAD